MYTSEESNVESKPLTFDKDIQLLKKALVVTLVFLSIALSLSYYTKDFVNHTFLQTISGFFNDWGVAVLGGVVTLLLVVTVTQYGIRWFWSSYISPVLQRYNKIIEDSISDSTSDLSNNISQRLYALSSELKQFQENANDLLKDNLLESVVSRSEPTYLENKIDFIHASTYGSHCEKQEGLFGSIRGQLYPFLQPEIPHRSQHNQCIVVSEENGSIVWRETTQFEVHTICFDDGYESAHQRPDQVTYPLKFKSGGNYVDVKDMIIDIYVDDELVASLKELLEINEDEIKSKDTDILTIHKESPDFINFHFKKDIIITKKKVQVKVYEESFLGAEDNFYVAKREEPTYGSTINITLPTTWKFTNFTVPDENKWGKPNTSPYSTSNTRVADTNDWVHPGIVASCNWSRF